MPEPRSQLDPPGPERRRVVVLEVLALLALVCVSHFARLDDLPIMGEEGRRAHGAIHMLETGDWIVVKNQGVVFPDRPPMTNWLIAWAGLARGEVDKLAVRLPSVLAVLATALLLYAYCRRLGSRLEALAAPAVFLTFGQVLQLGRLGESEAVFTLFLAAALLLWHLGFALGRSPAATWSVGYGLAALAALTKGLQAPVYFVGATAVFLAWRREWRWLLGRGQWIGVSVFLALVMAWQIPYYLATDRQSAIATWFAVVGPRLTPDDLLRHLATFPLELFGALLPWSAALLLIGDRGVRRALREGDTPAAGHPWTFVLVSLAVTFPTVWLSAGARPRYYLPMVPLLAVAVAGVLAAAVASAARSRSWPRFLTGVNVAVGILATVVVASFVVPSEEIAQLRPSGGWLAAILLAGVAAVAGSRAARAAPGSLAALAAVPLAATFFAALYSGSVLDQQQERLHDAAPGVAALRARLPPSADLISFGPVHTQFLYHWGRPVPEVRWPRSVADLPAEVEYFAFDRRPSDTPEERLASRGMVFWTTPGTLPFAWEEIGAVDCSRGEEEQPEIEVVVGRVLRDATGRPLPGSAPGS